MFFSMVRLSLMAAGFLLPIHVQAVAFSVDSFEGIAVGKPMSLSWWGDKTPVTIKLLQGPPEALEAVVTIAPNLAGDSYTWTPTTIPAGTYVLSITQGTETNYSPQFPVAGTPAPASAGAKPVTKAVPPVATGHVLPPALIAAHYPPAGYDNGSRGICAPDASGNGTSAAFPCDSSVERTLGHFPRSVAGIVRTGGAIGAAVVGMAFACMLVL
ncbi:hypothetical protein HO173_000715 [Letharia columbiana]|uniref:Yeast cell wall synthesis Kre9/Knh1-like N-terminal domain-containing protein n=1 Tax=Letharia columbiana TaxID=112416 RepID=A0A8H6G5K5_9LECA|nr:uncharacterized protein HO173_000715 [Letharia columbiana]KAF6240923.1 hypothetical protein HO173_000715 [Letharia columbiana]